jgi:hypothetical protein
MNMAATYSSANLLADAVHGPSGLTDLPAGRQVSSVWEKVIILEKKLIKV